MLEHNQAGHGLDPAELWRWVDQRGTVEPTCPKRAMSALKKGGLLGHEVEDLLIDDLRAWGNRDRMVMAAGLRMGPMLFHPGSKTSAWGTDGLDQNQVAVLLMWLARVGLPVDPLPYLRQLPAARWKLMPAEILDAVWWRRHPFPRHGSVALTADNGVTEDPLPPLPAVTKTASSVIAVLFAGRDGRLTFEAIPPSALVRDARLRLEMAGIRAKDAMALTKRGDTGLRTRPVANSVVPLACGGSSISGIDPAAEPPPPSMRPCGWRQRCSGPRRR